MVGKTKKAENIAVFLTVSKAAEHLGVSANTLRNWDRSGKLVSRRNPMNGYRLYRVEDLEKILQKIGEKQ